MSSPHARRKIIVREVTTGLDDRLAIQALYEEVFVGAAWRAARPAEEPTFADVSEGETVFVAVDEAGTFQGVVSVFKPDSFIHHLYVGTRFQRRGVGTALLDRLQATLQIPWRLKCVAKNASALAFYEKSGWREVDRGHDYHGEFIVLQWD